MFACVYNSSVLEGQGGLRPVYARREIIRGGYERAEKKNQNRPFLIYLQTICYMTWTVAPLSVGSSLFRVICCKSVSQYVVSRVVFFSKPGGRVLPVFECVVGVLGVGVGVLAWTVAPLSVGSSLFRVIVSIKSLYCAMKLVCCFRNPEGVFCLCLSAL